MSEGGAGVHWLVLAMEEAQVGDATRCALAPDAPVGVAWPWVADFLNLTEHEVTVAVAGAFHLELADLSATEPEALSLLPKRHAIHYGVLPIRCTDRDFVVATSEPLDFDAEREIGFLSGRNPVFVLASPTAISEALPEWYRESPKAKSVLDNVDYAEAVQNVRFPPDVSTRAPAETGEDQIGGVVALILHEAVKAGVSKIHLTPRGSTGQVLLKEDTDSTTLLRLPVGVLVQVAERIGLLADLPAESEAAFGGLDVYVEDVAYAVSVHVVPGLAGQMILLGRRDLDTCNESAQGELPSPLRAFAERHVRLNVRVVLLGV